MESWGIMFQCEVSSFPLHYLTNLLSRKAINDSQHLYFLHGTNLNNLREAMVNLRRQGAHRGDCPFLLIAKYAPKLIVLAFLAACKRFQGRMHASKKGRTFIPLFFVCQRFWNPCPHENTFAVLYLALNIKLHLIGLI